MANPFGGMGGFGGPGMKKAIETLQKKMMEDAEKMNQRLEATRVEASSGGGMVNAVVNGQGNLLEVKIRKEAVDPEDVELLEDMVVTAVREALEKAEAMREEEQKKLVPTNIPGLPPGLF